MRLGPKTGAVYPVIAGLREGEKVVTHGAFTLDADLQIRGGLSMMTVSDDTGEGPYDQIVEIAEADKLEIGRALTKYLALHEALAADDLAGAKAASEALRLAAEAIVPTKPPEFRDAWMPIKRQLLGHTKEVLRPWMRHVFHFASYPSKSPQF